jgi:hypothetical protein
VKGKELKSATVLFLDGTLHTNALRTLQIPFFLLRTSLVMRHSQHGFHSHSGKALGEGRRRGVIRGCLGYQQHGNLGTHHYNRVMHVIPELRQLARRHDVRRPYCTDTQVGSWSLRCGTHLLQELCHNECLERLRTGRHLLHRPCHTGIERTATRVLVQLLTAWYYVAVTIRYVHHTDSTVLCGSHYCYVHPN